VQVLTPSGYQAKIEFLQRLLVKCALNSNFIACILFANKVIFTRNKITNFHNDHLWTENPHIYSNKSLTSVFVHIGIGIIGNHFIGLYCNSLRLSVRCYLFQFFGEYITSVLRTYAFSWDYRCIYMHEEISVLCIM